MRRTRSLQSSLLLVPATAWMLFVFAIPVLLTINSALRVQEGVPPLVRAVQDTEVLIQARRTLAFALSAVAIEMLAGTALGLAVASLHRFRRVISLLLIVPLFTSTVAVGLEWRWLLDAYRPTWLPFTIKPDLLTEPRLALPLLAVITAWQWTPFVALVVQSAAAKIPSALLTTAVLDGLSWRTIGVRVAWPYVRRAFYWVLAWRLLDTLRTFDLVYVLTQGGPGSSTEVLSFTVFQHAFVFLYPERAAGSAVLLLLLSAITLALMLRALLPRSEHDA